MPGIWISGRMVPCHFEMVPVRSLRFLENNPRIYHLVHEIDGAPATQDVIYQCLASLGTTKKLMADIYSNGGLAENVIVYKGVVIEGNSRLAAYKQLSVKYPDDNRWRQIPAQILDGEIDNNDIDFLLGTYHVRGKSSWSAYEKAAFISRALEAGASADSLATEFGQGKNVVLAVSRAYRTMNDYLKPLYRELPPKERLDVVSQKYSHFEALFRAQGIADARKEHSFLRDFAKWVHDGVFPRAENVRMLPAILSDPDAKNTFLAQIAECPAEAFEKTAKQLSRKDGPSPSEEFHEALRAFDNILSALASDDEESAKLHVSTADKMRLKRVSKNIYSFMK